MTAPAVADGVAIHEAPDVVVKTAEFLLQLDKGTCVANGGPDLQTIAHDAWILEQPGNVAGAEARDSRGIEAGESSAVMLAFVQDRGPTQACLGAFQSQELEPATFIVHRHAPLPVVIGDVQRIVYHPAPRTAPALFGTWHQRKAGGRSPGCAVRYQRSNSAACASPSGGAHGAKSCSGVGR